MLSDGTELSADVVVFACVFLSFGIQYKDTVDIMTDA